MKFCRHVATGVYNSCLDAVLTQKLLCFFSLPPVQYFRVPYVDRLCDSIVLVITMLVWGYKIYIWQKPGISPWISTGSLKWHFHSDLGFCFVLLQHIGAKWKSLFWGLQSSAAADHEQERKRGLQPARMVLKDKWFWVSCLKDLAFISLKFHQASFIWCPRTSYSSAWLFLCKPSNRMLEKTLV